MRYTKCLSWQNTFDKLDVYKSCVTHPPGFTSNFSLTLSLIKWAWQILSPSPQKSTLCSNTCPHAPTTVPGPYTSLNPSSLNSSFAGLSLFPMTHNRSYHSGRPLLSWWLGVLRLFITAMPVKYDVHSNATSLIPSIDLSLSSIDEPTAWRSGWISKSTMFRYFCPSTDSLSHSVVAARFWSPLRLSDGANGSDGLWCIHQLQCFYVQFKQSNLHCDLGHTNLERMSLHRPHVF